MLVAFKGTKGDLLCSKLLVLTLEKTLSKQPVYLYLQVMCCQCSLQYLD